MKDKKPNCETVYSIISDFGWQNVLMYFYQREVIINCGCPNVESGGAAHEGCITDWSIGINSGKSMVKLKVIGFLGCIVVIRQCRVADFDHSDVMRPSHDEDYKFLMNLENSRCNSSTCCAYIPDL